MPIWLLITLGLIGGAITLGGVLYLSVRPYLAVKRPKAWMPEPTGRHIGNNYTEVGKYPGGNGIDVNH